MKKRMITLFVLAVLLCSLAACGSSDDASVLSAEEAQQIALEDLGFTVEEVADIYTHVGTYEERDCYSIHITIGAKEYEYIIDGKTGEILLVA